jgi:DnaJ-class molecular chaperone
MAVEFGGEIVSTLRQMHKLCQNCNGKGVYIGLGMLQHNCKLCDGKGRVYQGQKRKEKGQQQKEKKKRGKGRDVADFRAQDKKMYAEEESGHFAA